MVILTLLEGQEKTPTKQWCFENSSVIRIGRAADNHVVIYDTLVSRHHLELKRVISPIGDSQWQVISEGLNGTFLNGQRVVQSSLPDDCLLQMAQGGPTLRFQIREQSPSGCRHENNPPNTLFCTHCGEPLSVQQTIGEYRVLRTLGQGGMGTTYLAWGIASATVHKPHLFVLKQMNADMTRIAKAQELFHREAKTLKSLNHSGIPKYYDFFVVGGMKYLAMELVHGQDLEKRVYSQGAVSVSQATTWMIETCDILDYIHNQEPPLIHRDIKPANLMVRNSDNRIVVLDFGAVKETGTTPGTRIGAEGYCAPEQEKGQPLIQSDLYAIGPTLIFLITGENPFKFHRFCADVRFEVDRIPQISPQLAKVISRVTQTVPRDRYQSAKELRAALAACQR